GESEIPKWLALTAYCPQLAGPACESYVEVVGEKINELEDGGGGEQLGRVVTDAYSLHGVEGDAGSDRGHKDDDVLEQQPEDGAQEAVEDESGSRDQEKLKGGQRRVQMLNRRVQNNIKTYDCSECGKRLINKSHLDYHIRTHTGEKPYECEVCNKRFILKSSLDAHVRTHNGDKHECD
ncbi:zinc finger protein 157-like, partial [Frankliniella occidentalis]|uniref:Zinc finger protein 157-like n=1 Tax=Frankliniella occidentalis TaxID=133901 RepID=A0A9C6XAV8_FRAOC